MTGLLALVRRNIKLYFKDKGMFFSSLITPVILLVLYATFLRKVHDDSFRSALAAAQAALPNGVIAGCVGGQLVSSLLAVSCVAIDLSTLLAVAAGEQQRNGSCQLGFAHLLGYLHIGRVELPVAIGLQDAEQVADNLLLPVDELKGPARPSALGVAQALDEIHRVIRSVLIVDGVLGLECCGLIFLQLSQIITSNGHKK